MPYFFKYGIFIPKTFCHHFHRKSYRESCSLKLTTDKAIQTNLVKSLRVGKENFCAPVVARVIHVIPHEMIVKNCTVTAKRSLPRFQKGYGDNTGGVPQSMPDSGCRIAVAGLHKANVCINIFCQKLYLLALDQ